MIERIKSQNWARFFGIFLFINMMAAGYFYNLTFIQLGLEDLGIRILKLSAEQVARNIAILAVITCIVAIGFGYWMQKHGVCKKFHFKLKAAFLVVLCQTLLTGLSSNIQNEIFFIIWLIAVSFTLGMGVPVMFSMAIDLVPVRMRGLSAALITALAYFLANILPTAWTFESFQLQSMGLLLGGAIGMGILAFMKHPWLDALARQHTLPEFSVGRFVKHNQAKGTSPNKSMIGLILTMFGIYFVDSLGFLRLLKTPLYMDSAWQSPDFNVRLFIAGTHIVGALLTGILYGALHRRSLFLWIFGIFALVHLQYSFHIRIGSEQAALSMPMLYALVVSMYTVLSFALWADLSTPKNICLHSALGVALSGWTATFLSTALAVNWQHQLTLENHIQIVDALAILLFLIMLFLIYVQPKAKQNENLK